MVQGSPKTRMPSLPEVWQAGVWQVKYLRAYKQAEQKAYLLAMHGQEDNPEPVHAYKITNEPVQKTFISLYVNLQKSKC